MNSFDHRSRYRMPTGGGSWARLPWKTGCQTSSEDQEAPNNCCFTGGLSGFAGTEKPPLDGLQKGVALLVPRYEGLSFYR